MRGPRAPASSPTAGSITPDGRAKFLLRAATPMPEPPDDEIPAAAPHRPRQRASQWHTADADREISRAPEALSGGDLCRDQSRPTRLTGLARSVGQRVRRRRNRSVDGSLVAKALRHSRPCSPGQCLPPDALRSRQPPDAGPFRPLLPPAVLQELWVRVRPVENCGRRDRPLSMLLRPAPRGLPRGGGTGGGRAGRGGPVVATIQRARQSPILQQIAS